MIMLWWIYFLKAITEKFDDDSHGRCQQLEDLGGNLQVIELFLVFLFNFAYPDPA